MRLHYRDFGLGYSHNKESHAHMAMRQQEQLTKAIENPAENWMHEKLLTTGHKWTRQAQWGHRLFDFWSHHLGIAIEVDGPEHDAAKDRIADQANYKVSGIIVLRVKPWDEVGAEAALDAISQSLEWKQRREQLGITKPKLQQLTLV